MTWSETMKENTVMNTVRMANGVIILRVETPADLSATIS